MQEPMAINLKTSEEVRACGWAAEERDADGHLLSTHTPMLNDEDIVGFVREAMKRGGTVTIWPHEIKEPSGFDFAQQ